MKFKQITTNKNYFLFTFILFFLFSKYSLSDDAVITKTLEDAISISENDNKPVLVIFSAEWCKPCRKLKQDINIGKYNKELNNRIICFVDIENRPDLKKEYKVDSLPDSRVLVKMIEKNRIEGYNPSVYKEWLKTINE